MACRTGLNPVVRKPPDRESDSRRLLQIFVEVLGTGRPTLLEARRRNWRAGSTPVTSAMEGSRISVCRNGLLNRAPRVGDASATPAPSAMHRYPSGKGVGCKPTMRGSDSPTVLQKLKWPDSGSGRAPKGRRLARTSVFAYANMLIHTSRANRGPRCGQGAIRP